MENNINVPIIGLNTDTSHLSQPENTYSFALNTVVESNKGDFQHLSNENSNEIYAFLKSDFVLIGSVYIGDGETCLFSVKNDNSESEIGILSEKQSVNNTVAGNNYKTIVNDYESSKKDKLNFRTDKQIQAVYRLIKGCEKNVYWTDDYNPVRNINFANLYLYKNKLGKFVAKKFLLQKQFDKIPIFKNVEIIENIGRINPGTLTICIQYSDLNKNFTNFLTEVSNIVLYKDNTEQSYERIEGSLNSTKTDKFREGPTYKGVKLSLGNLDENYDFYRLAYIHYSDNEIQPTEIYLSQLYSTKQTTVVYTGLNYAEKTTIEYISLFNKNNKIQTAKSITQKDDRLLLGNTKEFDLNFKGFQKLASKINVDCVAKKVTLNDIKDPHNTKNPLHKINGTGFQPGEVYSLGIVYVFENGEESPVFHIPGKNNLYDENLVFNKDIPSEFVGVFPMKHAKGDTTSLKNNISSVNYTQRESCNNFDFWGLDSRGDKLINTKVRHHRFPTLKDCGLDFLISDESKSDNKNKEITYSLFFEGSQKEEISKKCSENSETILGCLDGNLVDIIIELDIDNGDGVYEKQVNSVPLNSSFENIIIKQLLGNIDNKGKLKDNKFTVKILKGVYQKLENGTYKVISNSDLIESDGKLTPCPNCLVEEVDAIFNVYYSKEFTFSKGSEKNNGVYQENYSLDFYNFSIIKSVSENTAQQPLYSHILGIHLSNIELPNEEETGKKCLGYYIVKQSRSERDRTFLDSGLVMPLTIKNNFHSFNQVCGGYHGIKHLWGKQPYDSYLPNGYSNKAFALLSPKHKFHDVTYDNFTDIIEVGSYNINYPQAGFNGASNSYAGLYVKNVNDKKVDDVKNVKQAFNDQDGMSLKCPIRFTKMNFNSKSRGDKSFNIKNDGSISLYNLDPINYSTVDNDTGFLYNLDAINKSLIFYSDKGFDNLPEFWTHDHIRNFPYVYIYNNHNTFYEDFQTAQYQKLSQNIVSEGTYNTLNGDLQLGFLRKTGLFYLNTESRHQEQKRSGSWLKSIVGVFATVVAGVLTIITAGVASPLLYVGVGLAIAGSVAYGAYGIIKVENFNKAMFEHWERGLKGSVGDTTTFLSYQRDNLEIYDLIVYQDDTIRWFAEIFGDILFETDINMSLRIKPREDRNNFIAPMFPHMKNLVHKLNHIRCGGNSINIICKSGSSKWYWEDNDVTSKSEIFEETFILNKLCTFNEEKRQAGGKGESGYEYRGLPIPELYFVNNDYQNQKHWINYYSVPFEYSFCSECNNKFPQRFFWSEVGNQESLNDNYKIFKPNNYKDVSGEYGEIMNMFTFNNNLYIHTTEALFVQPTNPQEQMLNETTIYIGTGEFGSLPPQLIVDDKSGTSAGLQHREAQILTPYGYFFVSERERKVYKFDGRLEPISDKGMSKWFNENIPLTLNKQYRKNNGEEYKYNDNPSNFLGTGFILTYDKERERIIITKKDYIPNQKFVENQNFEICLLGNNTKIFLDINKTKVMMEQLESDEKRLLLSKANRFTNMQGIEVSENERPKITDSFNFVGIENCEMKFETFTEVSKEITTTEIREVTIENNTDIWFNYDISGSMTQTDHTVIKQARQNLIQDIISINPSLTESNFKEYYSDAFEEAFHAHIDKIIKSYNDTDTSNKNLIIISFVNEDDCGTDKKSLPFMKHLKNDVIGKQFKTLKYISYPTVTANGKSLNNCNTSPAPMYKNHFAWITINMESSRRLELLEEVFKERNEAYTESEWNELKEIVRNYSLGIDEDISFIGNPYDDWGWRLIPTNNNTVSNQEFTIQSIKKHISNALIPPVKKYEEVEIKTIVKELKQVFTYLPGELFSTENIIDNGWTISYSLKYNTWTSFHSYQPNFYFRMNEKHFSWVNGNKNIYLHNKLNHYQTFYGKHYPYIVEYVDNNNPIVTKIFDHIRLLTDAQRFDVDTKEHYDERWITFNKAILYNSRQCSGELHLKVKDITPEQEFYLSQQVVNENNNVIFLDRNERDWLLNDFRDYRIEYNKPIFNSDKAYISNIYDKGYIDKILNEQTIDLQKDWYDLESLRDKYLTVRLQFDNYEDVKLIFNIATTDNIPSIY